MILKETLVRTANENEENMEKEMKMTEDDEKKEKYKEKCKNINYINKNYKQVNHH